jgi:hypothetical protein
MNMDGKFYKVGPPPNFWGASNDAWQRRIRMGNPPRLPVAHHDNPVGPPDPSTHTRSSGSTMIEVTPRQTGGPPDAGGPHVGPHVGPPSALTGSVRSNSPRSRDVPKVGSSLNDRVYWDGQLSTFRNFKTAITGHMLQMGAAYLVNSDFHHSYVRYLLANMDYLDSEDFRLAYPEVSPAQACLDRTYLYGMLLSSNRNGERKFLLKYSRTQDGISTWIDFLQDYDNNGSDEIRAEQLEILIQVPYTPQSPGDIIKYMDNLQAHLNELETLIPGTYDDSHKRRLLFRNLRELPSLQYLIKDCKERGFNYQDSAIYIRTYGTCMDGPPTRRKVHHTHLTDSLDLTLEEAKVIFHTMSQDSSPVQAYQALKQPTV